MNILILGSQVPFVTGGAEVLIGGLAEALVDRGHRVDTVQLPLAWNPVDGLLTTALAWRMLDVTTSNGLPVDRVICTKYPTWAVDHPRKALWLIHQHRQAYDWHGTRLSEFTPDRPSQDVRQHVLEIDRRGIAGCLPRYAISGNVAKRLKRYCGLSAGVLYPPVPHQGLRPAAFEPFILSVSRLDAAKRVDRLLAAWRFVRADLDLYIVGDGPERERLERIAQSSGLGGQVRFLGRVDDSELVGYYNACRAVYYAPIDEDYGYAAVESLAAGKPVITATDSGGVLEFVGDGESGVVTSLEAEALAKAIEQVADAGAARDLGAAGPARVANLTWDSVVDALLAG